MRNRQILCVAEKNSVAKSASDFLSNGHSNKRQSASKYNPIFSFTYQLNQELCDIIFTSVTGHIMELEFAPEYKIWKAQNPIVLLRDAQINKSVNKDKKNLEKNLINLAKNANDVQLWLDNDKEGEAIAFEVIEICARANRNLNFFRARFTSVDRSQVVNAINNLELPDQNLADSVQARQEIDLRIGACFTRFQCLTLQPKFNQLSKILISYGPCQFPTLGFVVERFKEIQEFEQKEFWYLTCRYKCEETQQITEFTWDRQRLFCEYTTAIFYSKVLEVLAQEHGDYGIVEKVAKKEVTKYKPYPMTTMTLQKLATSKLRFSSAHKVMDIAEKLYNKGYISYPRTETDKYPSSMNLKNLVRLQTQSQIWGNYADRLLNNNEFAQPSAGKHSDEAHPPIHPVKLANQNEFNDTDSWKIYDLVTRHFLASCSKHAKGYETKIKVNIGDERFSARGLQIRERNFLEIYPFETWGTSQVPNLIEGASFDPEDVDMKKGQTSPPQLLTEADLITRMDKEQIGTDATMAEHIKTIQDRNYATKQQFRFSPTNLGIALVDTYEEMGFTLSKPELRAKMERQMAQIAAGNLRKDQMLTSCLNEMYEIFQKVQRQQNVFIDQIGRFFQEEEMKVIEQQENFHQCGRCNQGLKLEKYSNLMYEISCARCNYMLNLPKTSAVQLNDFVCPACNFQTVKVISESNNEYVICPYCYNHPENVLPIEESAQMLKMPCFKCTNRNCALSAAATQTPIFACRRCNKCSMVVRKSKRQNFFVSCRDYPICKNSAYLPSTIKNVQITDNECLKCRNKNERSLLVELIPNSLEDLHEDMKFQILVEENSYFCIKPGCYQPLSDMSYKFAADIGQNSNTNASFQNFRQQNQTSRSNAFSQQNTSSGQICFKCKQPGHFANNCQNNQNLINQMKSNNNKFNKSNNNSGGQLADIKCYACKQKGHYANNCPNKNQPQQQQQNIGKRNFKDFNQQKNQSNNQKVCQQCGAQGRHPRGSACPAVKRKKL